jgi:hypothetical protein
VLPFSVEKIVVIGMIGVIEVAAKERIKPLGKCGSSLRENIFHS